MALRGKDALAVIGLKSACGECQRLFAAASPQEHLLEHLIQLDGGRRVDRIVAGREQLVTGNKASLFVVDGQRILPQGLQKAEHLEVLAHSSQTD